MLSLQESGALIGLPLHIPAESLGRSSVRMVISVMNRDENTDQAFREFGRSHAFISDFVISIGDWDYEFNIQIESQSDLQACLFELQQKFSGNIVQIRTMTEIGIQKLHRFDFIQAQEQEFNKDLRLNEFQ